MSEGYDRDATISSCGRYRYTLDRTWDRLGPQLIWVMLNPSTADAHEDDPTIRRCVDFAQRWGYGGIRVVNLYALRATDPDRLWEADDPIGPDNNAHLRTAFLKSNSILFAWGNGGHVQEERVEEVERLAGRRLDDVCCLGRTATGTPRHPLYLPKNAPVVRWKRTDTTALTDDNSRHLPGENI